MAENRFEGIRGIVHMNFDQIFDMVNIGIVVLDRDIRVRNWNRWMELHSKISRETIIGAYLFDFYPNIDTPWFARNFKSVSKFGNFAFFSQKLHKYLFPFDATTQLGNSFDYMQQSCTMGPLRDREKTITHIFLIVQDVTEVASYQRKLEDMNLRDSLTGIYNRRYLEFRLEQEFERFRRYGRPFSVIMQDIDFFKRVNDLYGHQAGDYILKNYAVTVRDTIRKVDVIARYGGEEFCCMLPETSAENAMIVAENIRGKVEDQSFFFNGKDIRITVSQGVSELSRDLRSPEEVLYHADLALYEAKTTGRNRVVKSPGPKAS